MDEAEYCHRVALMYAGRMIALDAPGALKRNLSSTVLFYLDTPDPLGGMTALEHDPAVTEVAVFGGGLHVTLREEAGGSEAIRKALASHDVPVRDLKRIEPSMEDVFVTLIEREEKRKSSGTSERQESSV
jgi:ABC-2 type transport system ATP-binding protein